MVAILGRKTTMTQVYDDRGRAVPATVIDVSSCVVVARRTEKDDGYSALQLGFGQPTKRKLTKPVAGYFKKLGIGPVGVLQEVRMDSTDEFEPGKPVGVGRFQVGDKVDVSGLTKGRGFCGGVKRWGWSTGPRTHGNMSHRRVGSIGAGTSPGRILKGRTMPGQYGNEKVTIRHLKVVQVDEDKGLLYVTGAVPGNNGGVVLVRKPN